MTTYRLVGFFTFTSLALTLGVALAGCATTTPSEPAATPATTASSTPAAASFSEQVAAGQSLYGGNCAGCHGAAGQGDKAPRLVGLKEGALPLEPPADRKFRTGQFKTVADVAQFVVANMPPKTGGGSEGASLTGDQYWAILAFDLHANGIDLPSPLTPALAATLTIPR